MLMSASAEKLGLAPDGEPHQDLDEARRLITALAGLIASSQEYLDLISRSVLDGHNVFALLNDDVLIPACVRADSL